MIPSTPASRTVNGTLLLSRSEVEQLLTPDDCIAAVEDAFRQHALGKTSLPAVMGLHAQDGSFHVKAALFTLDRPYFAAKTNANFPNNGARHRLPTIQGALILCDAVDGQPLAVMDSMSITALRTAAATAVAARYLAMKKCDAALLCGCGAQALPQLRALLRVRSLARILVHDRDQGKAATFASVCAGELGLPVTPVTDLMHAICASDIVITCTTAQRYFVARDMVRPGTFVAGVGADNEEKQELDPLLLAQCKLVTDITEQCCAIGDLHHALAAGTMSRDEVHAELGEIVAGIRPARTNDNEIIVFDSTGTALQDAAAAATVYRRALASGGGTRFCFNS